MKLKSNKKIINHFRKNYIDVLRGIAILFVVIFHYTYHYSSDYLLRNDNWSLDIAKFGWTGVDLFFIVSGYCIGMTIIKTHDLMDFIVKRFARLYPSYFLAGLITLIFYTLFELPGREVDWHTGIMNLIFANFLPGLNYQYIDGIYWALIVEIKFYLFFGIIFFLTKSLNKSINIWLLVCLIGNLILSFDEDYFIFFTSIFPHANLFLFGLTLFAIKRLSNLNISIICTLLIISIFTNDRYQEFEIYFLFLLSIVGYILFKKINFKFNIFSYIGLVSYTWYLTHNAVGIIIIRELNKLNFESVSVLVAIFLTFSLSTLIYFFIEIKAKLIVYEKYKKIKLIIIKNKFF